MNARLPHRLTRRLTHRLTRRLTRSLPAALLFLLLATAGLLLLLPGSHPAAQDRAAILAAPSTLHWAGTDDLGRDRAVRTAAALLLSLAGATAAAVLTTFLAAAVGITAAFSPAPLAWLLLLIADVFLTLPWLFLLMIVRAGLPLSVSPLHAASLTFLLLAVLGWPACAHAVARGAARLRHSQPMRYGRAAGLRPLQAIRVHILPHLRALLLPQFLLAIPAFVMAEANLGALGLGIPEPLPSLGAMLLDLGNSALLAHSSLVLLPVVILVTVLVLLEAIAPHTGTEA